MPNLSRVLKGGMAISFNMELEYLNNFSALRQARPRNRCQRRLRRLKLAFEVDVFEPKRPKNR